MSLRMFPRKIKRGDHQASLLSTSNAVKNENQSSSTLFASLPPAQKKSNSTLSPKDHKHSKEEENQKSDKKPSSRRSSAKGKTLSQLVADLEHDERSLQKEKKLLGREVIKARNRIEELEVSNQSAKSRVTELESANDKLKTEKEKLESKNEELKTANRKLSSDLEAEKASAAHLAADLATEKQTREQLAEREKRTIFESRWSRTALSAAFKLLPALRDQTSFRSLMEKTRTYILEKEALLENQNRQQEARNDRGDSYGGVGSIGSGGARAELSRSSDEEKKVSVCKTHHLSDGNEDGDDDDDDNEVFIKAEKEWAELTGWDATKDSPKKVKVKREEAESVPLRNAKRDLLALFQQTPRKRETDKKRTPRASFFSLSQENDPFDSSWSDGDIDSNDDAEKQRAPKKRKTG